MHSNIRFNLITNRIANKKEMKRKSHKIMAFKYFK